MRINRISIDFICKLLLLFILTNVMNQWAAGMVLLFYGVTIYTIVRNKMKIYKGSSLALLFGFVITYTFINAFWNGFSRIEIVLFGAFFTAYVLGYNLNKSSSTEEGCLRVESYFIFIAIVSTLYNLVCIVTGGYNSLVDETSLVSARYVVDFWSKSMIHPTEFNNRVIYAIPLLFYALAYIESMQMKLTIIVCSFINLYVSVQTASRTNIYLTVAMFLFSAILKLIDCRKVYKNEKKEKRNRMRTFCVILALILIIAVNYNKITVFLNNSALFYRIGVMGKAQQSIRNDGRWSKWYNVISQMWDYPMGNMPFTGQAHNILLDVFVKCGAVPFVLLFILFGHIIFMLVCIFRKTNIRTKYKYLILLELVCVMISFMLEPVIEGRPLNLMLFLFMVGLIESGIYKKDGEELK